MKPMKPQFRGLVLCLLLAVAEFREEIVDKGWTSDLPLSIHQVVIIIAGVRRAAEPAIAAAVDDVNSGPSFLSEMKLNFITLDTNCSGFLETMEAFQLMEDEVVAATGPQSSGIAHVISHVVNKLHVPLLSFGATDPTLSSLQYPYFLRTARSDHYQMYAIADLVGYYGWREVIAIFVDDDYGRNEISMLGDALSEKHA